MLQSEFQMLSCAPVCPPVHVPAHAYVPGKNQRHDEAAFDAVKQSVKPGLTIPDLFLSSAFRHGLEYIDKGYFWEAHEVLEPVWLALPQNCSQRKFVQGLIQLANGFLKLEMDMPKASLRLANMAKVLLEVPGGLEGSQLEPQIFLVKVADLEFKAKLAL